MLRIVSSLLVFWIVSLPVWGETDSLELEIESGRVRGFRHQKTNIFEFFDIPYATAPTGVNKFQPPLEAPKWHTTLDAIDTGIICPQPEKSYINKVKDEDCLLASVFVQDTTQNNLPVVVYVHGGAFQFGYGNWIKPYDMVKEHNIVAVTFNYRLGIHGFLCLGTKDIPGNAGMKDQVALLRWVQKNIANFGGSPDDVTIAGFSAGSASVDLLMLSKSARGLFNKVIPESGSNLAAFAIQTDPLESAKWFANFKNFDNVDDINALAQFYKTASWEILTSDSFDDRIDSTFVFSPCVERVESNVDLASGSEVFLNESPTEIIKNEKFKKVPLLYGFANMEGLWRVPFFEEWKTKMNEKFSDFLPADLIFESEEEKESVARKVKEFYFGDQPVSHTTILNYVDFFSDIIFAYPVLRSVKLQLEKGHDQVFLYEFNYVDEQTSEVPYTNVRGANHVAQTVAVFGGQVPGGDDMIQTEQYSRMSSTIRELWANFIKTGKPVPEGSDLPPWPAVSFNWAPHMSIGNELTLKGSLLLERANLWEDIYKKHYSEPVPPSTLV